jgi:transcriptional regulator with GAF, ATPase, and Fis domain
MGDNSGGSGTVLRLMGESPQIAAVRRLIMKAARNRLPVLLLGESGTGKEVAARSIHEAGGRGQFVPIDCGSLVGTLMESELFGHVRGAFSGAVESKRGLVEVADGGTAFFDEIGDLPLEMQVKLLRLLQEREFRPVGALQWKKVDLRIIAATHRDLKAEVKEGRFRLDLFYRMNVFPIHIPPLRERPEDVPVLAAEFAGEAAELLSPEILDSFLAYGWPGNVRELQHTVQRMVALRSEGALLRLSDVPSALSNHLAANGLQQLAKKVLEPQETTADLPEFRQGAFFQITPLPQAEKQEIAKALHATNRRMGKTAQLLGISRTTLYRRMRDYKL